MADQYQRQDQQAREEEHEHGPLPTPKVAAHGDANQEERCDRHGDEDAEAEVLPSQADAHELGADGQEVEQEDAAG